EVGRVFLTTEVAQADEDLGLNNASWTHANTLVHSHGLEAGIAESNVVDGSAAIDLRMSTLHGQTRGELPLAFDVSRLVNIVGGVFQPTVGYPGFEPMNAHPNRTLLVPGLGNVMLPIRSVLEESGLESDVESSGNSVESFAGPNTDIDESLPVPFEDNRLSHVSSSLPIDSLLFSSLEIGLSVADGGEAQDSGRTVTESVPSSSSMLDKDEPIVPRVLACPSRYIVYYATRPGTNQVAQGLYLLNVDTVSSFDRDLLPVGFDGVLKTFRSCVLARQFHQELVDSGIYALLRCPGEDSTYYIVRKGVHPGVYSTKRDLVIHGLRYRGGFVESFERFGGNI
ncbi:hypothetical protein MPER_10788, partial [Moniliophthora perniciosa FA553]